MSVPFELCTVLLPPGPSQRTNQPFVDIIHGPELAIAAKHARSALIFCRRVSFTASLAHDHTLAQEKQEEKSQCPRNPDSERPPPAADVRLPAQPPPI
jgi:hypothetical protein